MKIYGNNFSFNSNKVRFAANALGLNYEFESVDLAAGQQRTPEFLKINPSGRIPSLVDGAFTIFESNAIIRYLAEKNNSSLYPKDLQTRSIVNQWMDFGSIHVGGAVGKILFNTIIYKMVGAPIDERSLTEGRQFLTNHLKLIESQLKSAYITGTEMTLADIVLIAALDPCEVLGFDISAYPKVSAWRKKLQAQAFYQKLYTSYGDYVNSLMQKA
jgi:glutathione S-transferase